MSEFFASQQDTAQSRLDAALAPDGEQEDQPNGGGFRFPDLTPAGWLGRAAAGQVDWGDVGDAAQRGMYQFGGGIDDIGGVLANIPNTAFETPSYLLPDDPVRREAIQRVTDPTHNDQTALSRFFEENRDLTRELRRGLEVDPASQNEATRIISGLAEVMAPALAAGPFGPAAAPAALGLSTEERTYTSLVDQGVDEDTARGGALQDSAFMTAMGLAPISIPGRIWQRAASGAAVNLGFGAAMRGNMNAYLTEQGYPELAAQYQWLDPQAATIDAVMGATFGVIFGRPGTAARPLPQHVVDAAIIEAQTIQSETAFGVPVDHQSARYQRETLARMEEQAARDEPLSPGPVPEGVDFVPLPSAGEAAFDAAIVDTMRDQGVADPEARLEALREEARARGIDPDEAFYSFGPGRRGVDPWRGNERFSDTRLTERQNKIVELARNNHSNAEIAEEMDVTTDNIRVTLSQVRKRAPDLRIDTARTGSPLGLNSRTYERTATIEQIVALHNKLHRQGYRNRLGRPFAGRRNINTVIGERLGLDPTNVAKRLLNYRRGLASGRIEGEALYAVGEGEGVTAAELNARAEEDLRALGLPPERWADLARNNNVEIVATRKDIPRDGFADVPPGVQAVHFSSQGKTYFVADNIHPDDLKGLILHEIGVHHGMEDMLGARGFKEVLRQIDRMVEEEHPDLVSARGIAERYASSPDQVGEETLAYLIETKADLPIVNRVLSRLRQWLIKTFGTTFGMRLTVEDLRALAVTSLRRVAEQARREAVDVVEIVPPVVAPDAGSVRGGDDLSRILTPPTATEGHIRDTAAWMSGTLDDMGFPPVTQREMDDLAARLSAHDPYEAVRQVSIRARSPKDEAVRDILSRNPAATDEMLSQAWAGEVRAGTIDSATALKLARRYRERNAAWFADQGFDAPAGALPAIPEWQGTGPTTARVGGESGRTLPDGGSGDGGKFSVNSRQNGPDLLGATRDPIDNPDYQRRLADVRARAKEGGYDEAGDRGPGGLEGVSRNADPGRSSGSNPASVARPSRALILAVRDISGIHLATKPKSNGFGTYRVTIDTPFASDADVALHGNQGTASYVDFDIRDGSNKRDAYPGLHIRLSSLNHAARNMKTSVWLYRQIIEWATRQNMAVYSDHVSISPEAQRTYSALRRRGYDIEVIARTVDKDSEGYLVNTEMRLEEPIFRINNLMPIEERLVGAAPPEGDYQIDGPTLRDRQAAIEEARTRAAEFEELAPAARIAIEDPDANYSFGAGRARRAITAAKLREDAMAESAAAREMRKGYEAAARCAARHGAQSFITMGATPAASASAGLGQVLGLGLSIPLGVTAAPMIAQNADPRGYSQRREATLRANALNAMGEARAIADEALGSNDERFPVTQSATAGDSFAPMDLDEAPDPDAGRVKPGQATPATDPNAPKAEPAMEGQDLIDLFDPILGAEMAERDEE